jgi:hypothetical protein
MGWWDQIKKNASDGIENVERKAGDLGHAVVETGESAWDTTKKFANRVAETEQDVARKAGELGHDAVEAGKSAWDGTKKFANDVADTEQNVEHKIGEGLEQAYEFGKDTLKKGYEAVTASPDEPGATVDPARKMDPIELRPKDNGGVTIGREFVQEGIRQMAAASEMMQEAAILEGQGKTGAAAALRKGGENLLMMGENYVAAGATDVRLGEGNPQQQPPQPEPPAFDFNKQQAVVNSMDPHSVIVDGCLKPPNAPVNLQGTVTGVSHNDKAGLTTIDFKDQRGNPREISFKEPMGIGSDGMPQHHPLQEMADKLEAHQVDYDKMKLSIDGKGNTDYAVGNKLVQEQGHDGPGLPKDLSTPERGRVLATAGVDR